MTTNHDRIRMEYAIEIDRLTIENETMRLALENISGQTTVELADWLAQVREGNEESIARNDPVIRSHVAKLAEWEKMVRGLAGRE